MKLGETGESGETPATIGQPLDQKQGGPGGGGSIGAMTGEENYIEHALHVGEELTGLSLEQLGFEPRLEDLAEDQRNRLDVEDKVRLGIMLLEIRSTAI